MKEQVYDALNRAVLNGYVELRGWGATRLAQDLTAYADEFAEVTVEELVPFCQMWLDGVP